VAHTLTPVQPQVIAFDEETYRAAPTDTFQSISDKFYHSKAYDRALLLFNRDHPASTGDLAADAVAPRPGQTVYIPPLSILEDRYPQTLPNLPPLPRPHPAGSGATTAPATVASYAATFRVPDGGLSFYQAAQQALGSGDRWSEIYRLNPNYDPRVPLPAGAVLRLPPPAGAR
jgi:nucleoid-associated protein YgaU